MLEWVWLLAACFGLGALHGVIPDEHTWPITFSYSVGSATGPGGVKSAAWFSAAFTLQRAIMSELVFVAFGLVLVSSTWINGPVYLAVGAAMAIAGFLILTGKTPHVHPLLKRFDEADLPKHQREIEERGTVPVHWATIHGFIAGFGVDTGLFTTFVYLLAVPAMPSAALGWAPGALFGAGTFVVLMLIGLVFGGVLGIARRWGAERIQRFGRLVGARVLLLGGIAFAVSGAVWVLGGGFGATDIGTVLILIIMVGIALPVMVFTWREVRRMPGHVGGTAGG